MDVDRAKSLRQFWKSKGNPPCTHLHVDPESNASGYFTGNVVCKSCGTQIQTEAPGQRSADKASTKETGWGRYALYTSMGLIAAAVPIFTVWYKRRRKFGKFEWGETDQFLP